MGLNENSGGLITEAKARELISDFDKRFPGEVVSSFIGAANVNNILEQDDCIGLRIYNGYDEHDQKISLVLVGVDQAGRDMLSSAIIYDKMVTCPPTCPIEGLLSIN